MLILNSMSLKDSGCVICHTFYGHSAKVYSMIQFWLVDQVMGRGLDGHLLGLCQRILKRTLQSLKFDVTLLQGTHLHNSAHIKETMGRTDFSNKIECKSIEEP